jgi:hypothetical protein
MTHSITEQIRTNYYRMLQQTGSPEAAQAHTLQTFGIPLWQLSSIIQPRKNRNVQNTPRSLV